MLSHKSNMTFTNNSLVSEAWSCKDWKIQFFSEKILSSWVLSSPKITQEPQVKLSSSSPKCPRHRTAHVPSQNIGWSQLPINVTFFAAPTAAFIIWPFQFKYCKILGKKSETQPFAARPPDEAFPLRLASRQRQLLILETRARAGSHSFQFKNPSAGSAAGIWAPRGANVRNSSLLGPEQGTAKWQPYTLGWEGGNLLDLSVVAMLIFFPDLSLLSNVRPLQTISSHIFGSSMGL